MSFIPCKESFLAPELLQMIKYCASSDATVEGLMKLIQTEAGELLLYSCSNLNLLTIKSWEINHINKKKSVYFIFCSTKSLQIPSVQKGILQ